MSHKDKKKEMKDQKKWIHCDKKTAAAAILVTAAMFLAVGLAVLGEGADGLLFVLAILLSLCAGLFVLVPVKAGRIASALMYLLLPFLAFFALEHYTHVLSDLDPLIIVLNLLFFYLLYGLCALLFGSVRLGFGVATLVPMLFGLANYYVVSFRGSPIVPWDFLSLGTAMSVADNYSFALTWKTALVVIGFLWIILVASKSDVRFRRKGTRLFGTAIYAVLLCVYLLAIQKSTVQSFFGMDTTLFTLNVLYRNNGIAAAFLGNLRFLNIEQPDGYSPQRVQEIAAAYAGGDALTGEAETTDGTNNTVDGTDAGQAAETVGALPDNAEMPNIIVIMDEAFSDLSVWGDFATSEEVMPFFKEMQQEAVGGELYVSVKGGNTANTEYELLTGDTMGFLPVGSIPYQQYIKGDMPSLASYLKTLGYGTLAIHPYNRSGWDRDVVYDYFGFDEFLDVTDFSNPIRMRGYVSDLSAFDKIIEKCQQKEDGERLFVFEVTMQNHGGYSRATPDFDSYLKLPEVTNKTTSVLATEKYLTLMNETDCALERLCVWMREQEEPYLVLMLGDHQPSDYITNVIQRICGVKSDESLDYLQQGYRVPFLIWGNKGLEHQYYDGISVNYLGGILMEQAGLPLTGYQQFLKQLMEAFPVVNGNVYRDREGTFHSYGDGREEELLNEYRILQYNHLVDEKHRKDAFFGS